jgi:hypothetical protein
MKKNEGISTIANNKKDYVASLSVHSVHSVHPDEYILNDVLRPDIYRIGHR